jgi:indolepyruvate ferredoxin oxidoreductase
VVFKEGLNEDLAATAVWGSQQANLFPGATHDGVFGMWYGKAPGVDRTGDVFKHANFAGSFPTGGVLAVAGDDHACKSSTLPSQSEFAFQDFEMPVLSPADVQEVLDYGLLGISMSRFSGLWTGMIALADTMDSGVTIDVSLDRHKLVIPEFPMPPGGLGIRLKDQPMEKERRSACTRSPPPWPSPAPTASTAWCWAPRTCGSARRAWASSARARPTRTCWKPSPPWA